MSCNGVDTAIISCAEGTSGIGAILSLILNVMSIGIAIVAVIGLTVAGLQYLTARDNETQVRNAKKRISQIVIGIAVYALTAAILSWLLPSGPMDPADIAYYEAVEKITADTTVSEADTAVARGEGSASTLGTFTLGGSATASKSESDNAIVNMALKYAWPLGDNHNLITNVLNKADRSLVLVPNDAYKQALIKWTSVGVGAVAESVSKADNNIFGQGASCDVFVGTVVRIVTGDINYPFRGPGVQAAYMAKSDKWEEIDYGDDVTKMQPGDVMTKSSDGVYGHAQIFVGLTSDGKAKIAQAQHEAATGYVTDGNAYGGLGSSASGFRVFRYKG